MEVPRVPKLPIFSAQALRAEICAAILWVQFWADFTWIWWLYGFFSASTARRRSNLRCASCRGEESWEFWDEKKQTNGPNFDTHVFEHFKKNNSMKHTLEPTGTLWNWRFSILSAHEKQVCFVVRHPAPSAWAAVVVWLCAWCTEDRAWRVRIPRGPRVELVQDVQTISGSLPSWSFMPSEHWACCSSRMAWNKTHHDPSTRTINTNTKSCPIQCLPNKYATSHSHPNIGFSKLTVKILGQQSTQVVSTSPRERA